MSSCERWLRVAEGECPKVPWRWKRARRGGVVCVAICIVFGISVVSAFSRTDFRLQPALPSVTPGWTGPGFITRWPAVNFASALATDNGGNVYVVSEDRVQKFNALGTLLTEWSMKSVCPRCVAAYGIATDSSGAIYISTRDVVAKLDSQGALVRTWGSRATNLPFVLPGKDPIATDQYGHVYVLDSSGFEVQKFTSDGTFLRAWGSLGDGDGEFASEPCRPGGFVCPFPTGPKGIAAGPDGSVYVADTWRGRIERFSADGAYLGEWGRTGNRDGEFDRPVGLDADAAGNIYVADAGNNRVQEFTSTGRFITKWGILRLYGTKNGDGAFDNLLDLATDSADNIFTLDRFGVQRFGPGGIRPPGTPLTLTAAPTTKLMITGRARGACPVAYSRSATGIARVVRDCSGFRYADLTWNNGCTGEGTPDGWGVMLILATKKFQPYHPPGYNGPIYQPAPPTRDDYTWRFPDGTEVGYEAMAHSIALASGISAPGGSVHKLLLGPGVRVRPYFRAICGVRVANEVESDGFDVTGAAVTVPPYIRLEGHPVLHRGLTVRLTLQLMFTSEMLTLDRDHALNIVVRGAGLSRRTQSFIGEHLWIDVTPRKRGKVRIAIDGLATLPRSNIVSIPVR